MTQNSKIQNIKANDNSISANKFNSVIDSVNRMNQSSFEPTANHLQTNDGITQQNINIREENNHPFKIGLYKSKVSATVGTWTRNQTAVTLVSNSSSGSYTIPLNETQIVVDIDDFKKAGDATKEAGVPYYVYVQLLANVSSTTYQYDHALIPGELNMFVDSDADTAHQRSPNYLYNAGSGSVSVRDLWIKDKEVIGTVMLDNSGTNWLINTYSQHLTSDIDDYQMVPDALTNNDTDNSKRLTIENNPYIDVDAVGSNHFGELQLNEVNNCAGQNSISFPFFLSSSTDNSIIGPSGGLEWAGVDRQYFPHGYPSLNPFQTLEVRYDENTNNVPNEASDYGGINRFRILGLNQSHKTYPNSLHMAYYHAFDDDGFGQTQGALQWAALDTLLSGSSQRSLQIITNAASVNISQLYAFNSPYAYTPATADKVLMRAADGPTLSYADAGDFIDWLDDSGDFCTEVKACITDMDWLCDEVGTCGYIKTLAHTDLTDIDAGNYTAHDHKPYWMNGLATTGDSGVKDIAYTQNYGSSIGNTTAKKTIDLAGQLLMTDNVENLSWDTTSVDVASTTLLRVLNVTDATTKDTGALVVEGGVGIEKAIFVGGKIHALDITDSTTKDTGSLIVEGGAGVEKAIYAGNEIVGDDGGTYEAIIGDVDNTRSGYFQDETYSATLCNGTVAGYYSDGTLIAELISGGYAVNASFGSINTEGSYYVDGTQVVTNQGAAVADATDAATAITQLNALLARVRVHGLIA